MSDVDALRGLHICGTACLNRQAIANGDVAGSDVTKFIRICGQAVRRQAAARNDQAPKLSLDADDPGAANTALD